MTSSDGDERAELADDEHQDPDWAAFLEAAVTVGTHVVAQDHLRALTSGSRPHLFSCDDGNDYAVKFRGNPHGNGRGIFTEQVVARLGQLIGAPVPEVRLISVTAELLAPLSLDIGGNPAEAGLHHGSRWAHGFSDRSDFVRYPDRNREGFAALHLLYSWLVCTSDHQVIYRNAEPHDVMSVDHGMFLPGSTAWTAASLRSSGRPAK